MPTTETSAVTSVPSSDLMPTEPTSSPTANDSNSDALSAVSNGEPDATTQPDIPMDESAEVKRLKNELAKHKAAFDKAAKEAADYKRKLRASQTEEEKRTEEEQERNEAIEKELKELRKQVSVTETSKKFFAVLGDEETANTIAEAVYGADDPDTVIEMLRKTIEAREKRLRMEYGKIPAPASGSPEDDERARNLDYAKQIGMSRSASLKSADNGLGRFMN